MEMLCHECHFYGYLAIAQQLNEFSFGILEFWEMENIKPVFCQPLHSIIMIKLFLNISSVWTKLEMMHIRSELIYGG